MTALDNAMNESLYKFYSPDANAPVIDWLGHYRNKLNTDEQEPTNLASVSPAPQPSTEAGRTYSEIQRAGTQSMGELIDLYAAKNPGYLKGMMGVADEFKEKDYQRSKELNQLKWDAEERQALNTDMFATYRNEDNNSTSRKNTLVNGMFGIWT